MRRTWLLAILCFVGTADAAGFEGAGSSAAAPLYTKWQQAYAKKTGMVSTYQSVGSSAGIKKITEGTVDFGASDAPMSLSDRKQKKLVMFPTVILGIVPFVNVPGVKAGELRLTPRIITGIYSGTVTTWNDPAIAEANPGLKLPKQSIVPVARSDGSGTTFVLTDYLSQVSEDWKQKIGSGFSVKWPASVSSVKGSSEVVASVKKTPGSIGYAEYAYVIEQKLDYVQLQNHDGRFVSPSADSFKAALAESSWAKTGNFEEMLTNKPGSRSWPITGGTYVFVPLSTAKPERTAQALQFFTWAFISGDDIANSLDYVRLPDRVQARVFQEITSVVDQKGRALPISIHVQ